MSQHVRSYSYNWEYTGGEPGTGGRNGQTGLTNVRVYRVRNPSQTLTFIEQHEDSLGHPSFVLPTESSYGWFSDIPGGRHGRSSAIAFVDGHVETKKWTDPRTIPPVLGKLQYYSAGVLVNNADLAWLAERRVRF